jgi:hypothetical protein
MAVRKVSNWGGNIIGSFPSLKMEPLQIDYESTIERDLLPFHEYDPTVIAYYAQPMVIVGTDMEGEKRRYTPDFLVIRTSCKEIVECKPETLINGPDAQRQIYMGQAWADANSHDFVIVTDTSLHRDHTLANLKLFWRYARLKVPTVVVERCITHLKASSGGVAFEDLAIYLSSVTDTQGTQQPFEQAPYIYSMLFRHVLQVDLARPITSTTMMRLTSSKDPIQVPSYIYTAQL